MQVSGAPTGRNSTLLFAFILLTKAAILALSGERYGYMSDELYFLDAANYTLGGLVDSPPMIVWLAAALQFLGLDSILAIRAVATLLGVAVTFIGVDVCRLLGGGMFARWLTALVLLFAPGFLAVQSILTMNGLDQLWWFGAFWLTARYVQSEAAKHVLLLGACLGLGILSKLSILALCAALPIAFLLWQPAALRRAAIWYAAGVALLIAAPYVVWQILSGWPFLDFIAAYNSTPPKAMVLQNPVLGMLLTMNPGYALIWGIGAIYCLISGPRELRLLGTAAWLCLAVFVLAGVKFYFAVPVFGFFTVAGALFWEDLTQSRWRVPLRAGLILVGLSGLINVPGAAPVLPPERLQQLANLLRDGEQGVASQEPAELERYFPHFAEMHGWPELVALTTATWQALSPAQREGAILVGSYYGHSAALNLLDDADQLPPAHGRHMSYHLWAEGLEYSRGLFVGFDAAELQPLFSIVEERGELQCERCMARENGLKLHFVEGPRLPAAEIHAQLRRYYFF